MKTIAIVYVLYGSRAAAEDAATQMVERRFAACANVQSPCLSVYRWNSEMEKREERLVLFKTSTARQGALMAEIAAAHDYELPAISSWTAATTDDYAEWVEAETPPAS